MSRVPQLNTETQSPITFQNDFITSNMIQNLASGGEKTAAGDAFIQVIGLSMQKALLIAT